MSNGAGYMILSQQIENRLWNELRPLVSYVVLDTVNSSSAPWAQWSRRIIEREVDDRMKA